jgi:sigma-E factor negative regulatory protein RseC
LSKSEVSKGWELTSESQGGLKMAEQIGIVSGIEPGGWAHVLTDRKNACGGCHSDHGGGCRSCLAGAKMQIRVANHLGAHKGDVVKFTLRSTDFFKGAFLLYILPVIALMIGALSGYSIGPQIGWEPTSGAIAGSVLGLAAAVCLLVRMDRSQWVRRRLSPTMTSILSSEVSSTPQPIHRQPACCS